MNKFIKIFFLLTNLAGLSQTVEVSYQLGKVSNQDLNLKVYSKDSTANAMVLYESGFTKMIKNHKKNFLQTTYYYKIKIFNKDGYNQATKSIMLYHTKKSTESIHNIVAITHNLVNNKDIKTYLSPKNIYKEKKSEHINIVKFSLPKVRAGSVIEIKYVIETPYMINFTGWTFQSDIPKRYSGFHAVIPEPWVYNRILTGPLKLKIKSQTKKSKCFEIWGYKDLVDCNDLRYVMRDIPAFVDEPFLTSKSNFISKITFSLAAYKVRSDYYNVLTATWKSTDRELFYNTDLGKKLRYYKYAKRRLPDSINAIDNPIKRTKAIYHFVQNHFTASYQIEKKGYSMVKNAFKSNAGSSGQINLFLTNALNASGIKAHLTFISTRDNGLPTIQYPKLLDFNHTIVIAELKDSLYQLDASDKLASFGQLPFKDINGYGRALDVNNGSFWYIIKSPKNVKTTAVNLSIENDRLKGFMRLKTEGLLSKEKRNSLTSLSKQKYINALEEKSPLADFSIDLYRNKNLNQIDLPLIEDMKFSFDKLEEENNLILINPFVAPLKTNPLKSEKRYFSVDFGTSLFERYRCTLNLPKGYTINSIPKNLSIISANNIGSLVSKTIITSTFISIEYEFKLNKSVYSVNEYQSLKNLFQNLINLQNDLIVLKKK